MDIEYWAARWREGRIGFHEGRANGFLERHIARLGEKRRVLVPLCGKTEDMTFLASRGHEVVGIEAVEDAVRSFFSEHDLEPEVSDVRSGQLRMYRAAGVTILAGDVFACTKADTGAVDALYDRAALVALPAGVRPKYVAHLRALLPSSGALAVVVTFDYPQAQMDGPPFAVGEAELRGLFAGAQIEEIENAPAAGPRFREAGVLAVERCFSVVV